MPKDSPESIYVSGFQQVTEDTLGNFEALTLDYVPQEEGYMMVYTANKTNENLNVYFDDMAVTHTSGPIIRRDDYYPFGLTFNTGVLDGALTNNYLYNGKEKQELTGWYDYGARMYDAELGRWGVVDPISEKAYDLTPYRYAQNNPIKIYDPNGLDDFYDANGNFVHHIENKTDNIKVVNNDGMAYASLVDKGSGAYESVLTDYSSGINSAGLSDEAASNVFTDILNKMQDVDVSDLHNGKVSIYDGGSDANQDPTGFNDPERPTGLANTAVKGEKINGEEVTYRGKAKKGTIKVTVNFTNHKNPELGTVSNVQNALGVHEYQGHGKKKIAYDGGAKHSAAYKLQMQHSSWEKTTDDFQINMKQRLNNLQEIGQ